MSIIQSFDQTTVLHLNGFIAKHTLLTALAKLLAQDSIYLVPLVLLVLWFWPSVMAAGKKSVATIRGDLILAALTGVVGLAVLAPVIGHLWPRPRPFVSLLGTQELLFHRPDYSFPSDHAIFLFAIACTLLLLGYKRWGWIAFWFGMVVIIARVAVGVHWPTDVIAGAIFGFILAWLAVRFYKPLNQYIISPLMWIAHQLRLT